MIYITFEDRQVPALGYGTWQLKGRDCETGVVHALETGYRHIDTAQIYGNEAEVGAGIAASGVPREEIFLTTKVWMTEVRDGTLQKSVDMSLQKLNTDYVDNLLIHWPVKDIPFAEQLKALEQVQKDGRAKFIGVSNFTVAQLKEVTEKIGAKIMTDQVEYHPFLSQKPVLTYLRSQGMFLTAYSPLARGGINANPVIQKIAQAAGKTEGQVTLRWLLQQEGVAAIPKAGSLKHIKENFDIFNFTLSPADMQAISALANPKGRLVNPEWAPDWDREKAA